MAIHWAWIVMGILTTLSLVNHANNPGDGPYFPIITDIKDIVGGGTSGGGGGGGTGDITGGDDGNQYYSSASFSNVFGLHFVGVHSPNLVVADLVNSLGVEGVRYDIVLDEVNYAEIDEILAKLPGDVTIIATLHNSEDYPEYPIDMNAYTTTVKDLVARYENDFDVWQISNEVYGGPNKHWWGTKEQYVVMLNNAYDAIKEVDSNAVVILSGIATGTQDSPQPLEDLPDPSNVPAFVENPPILTDSELQQLQSQGRKAEDFIAYTWKYGKFDNLIDLHVYDFPEAINDRVSWVNEGLNEYGLTRDIILTETASIDKRVHPETLSIEEERKIQAIELVKRYVYFSYNGIKIGMWHGPYFTEENRIGEGDIKGTLAFGESSSLIYRPSYYTYEIMMDNLAGVNSITKIADGQYSFDSQSTFILWSNTGTRTIDLSSYINAGEVTVKHIVTALDANNNPIYPADEIMPTNSITIGESPILVFSSPPTENPFENLLNSIFSLFTSSKPVSGTNIDKTVDGEGTPTPTPSGGGGGGSSSAPAPSSGSTVS